jgi:hypothetical protein
MILFDSLDIVLHRLVLKAGVPGASEFEHVAPTDLFYDLTGFHHVFVDGQDIASIRTLAGS